MISTYNIRVIKKIRFKKILKKGFRNYLDIVKKINTYNAISIKYECDFPESWSTNDLDKNDVIRIGTLTGIIYFILENAKKETPKLTFTVIEFQKFFAHLDKDDLKTDDIDLDKYNRLIKELTQEEHPFGSDIYLNDNWELKGEKCEDIENYIKGIEEIKKSSAIKESIEDKNTLKEDIEKIDGKIIETKTNIALDGINEETTKIDDNLEFIEDNKPPKKKNILQQLKKYLLPLLILFILVFSMTKKPYLKNKIINFLDIDVSENSFEIETDNGGFLSMSKFKSGKIDDTLYDPFFAEIGDTIVISTKINNLTKDSIPVTINYPTGIAFKGNKLSVFGNFKGSGHTFFDEATLISDAEIDIVPLNLLRHIDYIENNEYTTKYILDYSESNSLIGEGLIIESVPSSENYLIVNSFYKIIKKSNNNMGFDPHPYKDADVYGFVSIHDYEGDDLDGKKDVLEIPKLKIGESYNFMVFVDFHNFGNYDLKNSKVRLNFSKKGRSYSQNIHATLSADYTKSIADKTLITGLPRNWEMKFVEGRITNTHNANSTSGKCTNEYAVNKYFSEKELLKGLPLGTLDTVYYGWCDQGHVIIEYSITNTDYK